MAWKPDYVTSAELKAYLRIGDTVDDAQVALAVTTASRDVDQLTNRQFGVEGAAVARRYTWNYGDVIDGRPAVAIDDLMSTTNLAVTLDTNNDGTFATTLTITTDFELWPWNAAADGWPWTHIVLTNSPASPFPRWPGAVKVTALYGWTAVPSAIKNATLLEGSRVFTARNSPFGIAGSPDMGSELRLLERMHPDAVKAARPYRRVWGAA